MKHRYPEDDDDRDVFSLAREIADARDRARGEILDRVSVPWGRFSELVAQVEALEKRVAKLEQHSFETRLRTALDRELAEK